MRESGTGVSAEQGQLGIVSGEDESFTSGDAKDVGNDRFDALIERVKIVIHGYPRLLLEPMRVGEKQWSIQYLISLSAS